MEKITRNVADLEQDERRVYEAALGEKLRENQQVILEVITVGVPELKAESGGGGQTIGQLPDWCNVYEGLSDNEISQIETLILDRGGWTREFQ
jgi:hypothetical protein